LTVISCHQILTVNEPENPEQKNSPWLEALALPAATDCFYQVSHSKLLISTALFQFSYF
jgi:hypothetical protein